MNNYQITVNDRNNNNVLSYMETFETFDAAVGVYEHIAERLTKGRTLSFRIWDGSQWAEPAINMETTIVL